jgi:hypothetical protein
MISHDCSLIGLKCHGFANGGLPAGRRVLLRPVAKDAVLTGHCCPVPGFRSYACLPDLALPGLPCREPPFHADRPPPRLLGVLAGVSRRRECSLSIDVVRRQT